MTVTKIIKPVQEVNAHIRIPGSKSITHRALLMAALADGESEVINPLAAEDTLLTSKALQQMGAIMEWKEDRVHVQPPRKRWSEPSGPIYLGNSGTSMRLLTAVGAAGSGKFIIDGNPRLRERPVGPLIEALDTLGVAHRYIGNNGYLPVELTSEGLSGGEVWVDARQSSQFLSALIIASPCARNEVRVGWHEPAASFPYVALTLSMLEQIGIEYRWLASDQLAIPAPQIYKGFRYSVEGDCSSASYFWAAAALKGKVTTSPIFPGSSQGDCRLIEVLKEMGCTINWQADGVKVIGADQLKPVDLDMNKAPDMVPTLAVLAAFARGKSRIYNVAHLRVKESDRLGAVASELSKFGVPVQELDDGLIIDGGNVRSPSEAIDAHDDHRIAMAFAVMGLCVEGVEIRGAESVAKSFPSFWDIFDQL